MAVPEDMADIAGIQATIPGVQHKVGINPLQVDFKRLHLLHAHLIEEKKLAVQVGRGHMIEIGHDQPTDAGPDQVDGGV